MRTKRSAVTAKPKHTMVSAGLKHISSKSGVAKKILVAIAALTASSAWAEHIFTICYHNLSTSPVSYINDGVSHKWKSRGELTGSGEVAPKETKCFSKIKDETLFTTHYITFTLGKDEGEKTYTRWVGIANSGFSKPFVFAQDAVETKTGKLADNKSNGKDNFELNIFIKSDGTFTYSNSKDINNTDAIITPRKFK